MSTTESSKVEKRALVFLAEGAEEMEVTIIVDVLRRAGVAVTLAGVNGDQQVRCSRGVVIAPDQALSTTTGSFDAMVLPGGAGGAARLAASPLVGSLLRQQVDAGGLVAAICAAPTALEAHQLFAGCSMTAHPGVFEELRSYARLTEEAVVRDGQLMTSRGPGTAFSFALAIVEHLCGAERAATVRAPLMLEVAELA